MLKGEHFELLEKLRFSEKASERKKALNDLKLLEIEGRFDEDDLLKLLEEKDFVFITYAIGAIGRLKIKKSIPALRQLFEKSTDPLILSSLLETFVSFGSNDFVEIVVARLNRLIESAEKDPSGNQAFLLEQIIAPSLKYFQLAGNQQVESTVSRFLQDSNPTIRWHALITYDRLGLSIAEKDLENLVESDAYALVREQASIMLEKRKSQ